jgi:hypothetical protein
MAFFGALRRLKTPAAAADPGVDSRVWTHVRTQPTMQDASGTSLTSETPQPATVPAGGWVHGLMPPARQRLTGGNAQAIVRELAFRGDTRSPDTIMAAGGMFPRGGTQWGTVPHQSDLNPSRHVGWDSPRTTVFVSCSRSYRIAKGFSGSAYVYLVRVNNGVDISNFGTPGPSMQCEVCALFGVKFEDILGVKVIASGNVYRNTCFAAGGLSIGQMNAALDLLANGQAVQPV